MNALITDRKVVVFFLNREKRHHSASGEGRARKREKREGRKEKYNKRSHGAGACFSQDRSRRDDNTRTHRHLGATIVKLGQVKARSVWDLLLGGRTGAGYRLGIIVLDSAVGLSREGCASRTRILRGGPGDDIGSLIGQIPEKNALLRLSLPYTISPSLFLSPSLALFFSLSLSIAAGHGISLVSWGRRPMAYYRCRGGFSRKGTG